MDWAPWDGGFSFFGWKCTASNCQMGSLPISSVNGHFPSEEVSAWIGKLATYSRSLIDTPNCQEKYFPFNSFGRKLRSPPVLVSVWHNERGAVGLMSIFARTFGRGQRLRRIASNSKNGCRKLDLVVFVALVVARLERWGWFRCEWRWRGVYGPRQLSPDQVSLTILEYLDNTNVQIPDLITSLNLKKIFLRNRTHLIVWLLVNDNRGKYMLITDRVSIVSCFSRYPNWSSTYVVLGIVSWWWLVLSLLKPRENGWMSRWHDGCTTSTRRRITTQTFWALWWKAQLVGSWLTDGRTVGRSVHEQTIKASTWRERC